MISTTHYLMTVGVVSPDKLPRETETVSTSVSTVNNLQERIFEPNSISHKKLLTESLLRRKICLCKFPFNLQACSLRLQLKGRSF
jgi:hypothetical protein